MNNGIQGGAAPRAAGSPPPSPARTSSESSDELTTRQFNESLHAWMQAATPGEDRLEAARRILFCFHEWDAELDLRHLELTRLPECLSELAHLSQLDVSHNRLDRLPEAIEELTSLRVLNLSVNQFDRVPNSLLALDSECSVWMAHNGVSAQDCAVFQTLSDMQDGPFVTVEEGMHGVEQWEQPDLGQEMSLHDALALWRHDLGDLSGALTTAWQTLDHPNTRHFGGWLARLRNTPDFANPFRRAEVVGRVRELLGAMLEDAPFRDTCLHIAHEAVGTCDDNVALGLNRLQMALHNRRAERGELSAEALFELGRGMFRLERLSAIAEEKYRALLSAGSAPDQVDVHLAYQAGLRESLNLPVAVSELRFASLAGVSREDLKRAAESILRLEAPPAQVCLRRYLAVLQAMSGERVGGVWQELRRHPLARFLAESYQPWQAHVARANSEEAARHAEAMFGLLDRIETEYQAGRTNEGEYLAAMNAAKFYANHGLAYQKALEMLGNP